MNDNNYVKIPGRLSSVALDGIVSGANEIWDDAKSKRQSLINEEQESSIAAEVERATGIEELLQSEISGLSSQNYVTVSTYSELPELGSVDTVYRVGSWDGTQIDPTKYAEYAWNNTGIDQGEYVLLSVKTQIGEVFDISDYRSGATYADLVAALDGGNNVPVGIRKGGMSIKYIQSSDNNYVQYRLMADEWSTTEADWQGVDDEPVKYSKNLIESGAVAENNIKVKGDLLPIAPIPVSPFGILVKSNFEVIAANSTWDSYVVFLPAGIESVTYNITENSIYTVSKFSSLPKIGDIGANVAFRDVNQHIISVGSNLSGCWLVITYYLSTQTELNPKIILNSYNGTSISSKSDFGIVLNPYFINGALVTCDLTVSPMHRVPVVPLANWSCLILKVKSGDIFVFDSVSANTSNARVWSIYDLNGNRLDYCSTESYTGILTISTDGYLYLNFAPGNTGTITASRLSIYQDFFYEFGIGILSVLSNLNNSVGEIENFEDSLLEPTSKNLYNGNYTNNSVISSGGDITLVPSWTYNQVSVIIPVRPNKYYYISGNTITAGTNIRCLDTSNNKIKVLAPQNGATISDYRMPNTDGSAAASTLSGMFKTPSNAVYVQFNIGTYNTSCVGKVMLEYVGDTYNPSFIPSAYEPYSEEKVVKFDMMPQQVKEALPAIDRNFHIKLLLIGSSHGMNTIAQFPWIASKAGFDVEVGNVYIGSLSLQRLVGKIQRNENIEFKIFRNGEWTTVDNLKFNDVIKYTDWNFVSLQRSATDDELWLTTQNEADEVHNVMTDINYQVPGLSPVYMSHTEALQIILNRISDFAVNHPTILFNTGFADPSEETGSTQTEAILETANLMKAEFGIEYVPVATAIRNARNTYLKNFGAYIGHYLCYDTQHLDYGIGCYVASITLLEYVLRKLGWDVETLTTYGTQSELQSFISVATETNYTEPTVETMSVAKACAKAACNMIDSVSEAIENRFKWQISYVLPDGITASNTKGYSAEGDVYKTTLSGTITSINVTMGGVDITSTAYNEGVVNIESVTGDVVITAS